MQLFYCKLAIIIVHTNSYFLYVLVKVYVYFFIIMIINFYNGVVDLSDFALDIRSVMVYITYQYQC